MKISTFAAGLLLSSLLTGPLHAENPFQISAELDKSIQAGLHALYNLEFEEAQRIFETLKPQAEEHPMIAFGLTSVHWWYVSVYVLETDPEASRPFLKSVNECIRLSKQKIKKGDPTGEGSLTLGGAEGLLGRWQAANQQWVSAYFKGKSAYKMLGRALQKNPKMMDAYMGLGIFDYYVATLPDIVRVLAFIGQGGDPQKGLEELQKAGYEGNYARTPALLFLVSIYTTLEHKPEKALPILEDLTKEYPKSPFIHMLRIIAFYNTDKIADLEREAADFRSRVEDKTYRSEFMGQAYFALGVVDFKKKNWKEALEDFDIAIKVGDAKDPFVTWTRLYKAYALDVLGRRQEAVAEYRAILKMNRRWGSHDNAKNRLKKPFHEKAWEMKTLVL